MKELETIDKLKVGDWIKIETITKGEDHYGKVIGVITEKLESNDVDIERYKIFIDRDNKGEEIWWYHGENYDHIKQEIDYNGSYTYAKYTPENNSRSHRNCNVYKLTPEEVMLEML